MKGKRADDPLPFCCHNSSASKGKFCSSSISVLSPAPLKNRDLPPGKVSKCTAPSLPYVQTVGDNSSCFMGPDVWEVLRPASHTKQWTLTDQPWNRHAGTLGQAWSLHSCEGGLILRCVGSRVMSGSERSYRSFQTSQWTGGKVRAQPTQEQSPEFSR